jgi:hypothetical protein
MKDISLLSLEKDFSCLTECHQYCDQPFVSETMRCASVDFIQKIDDKDKMLCAFMCEG